MSLLGINNRAKNYTNIDVNFQLIGNTVIHDARELGVRIAAEQHSHYLLFLDSDMTFPADIIEQLIKHGKDIVSGLYFKRVPPYTTVMYNDISKDGEYAFEPIDNWKKNRLIEVDAIGCGCVLIKTKVFMKIKPPFFYPLYSQSNKSLTSEDIAFCVRAREAGFKIYVDTALQCGHIGKQIIGLKEFEAMKND